MNFTETKKETLDFVDFVFKNINTINLDRTVIIGAQHILPSTLRMFNTFFENGLNPSNLFLIGKCYSTDLETYELMKKSGINVCPSSFEFSPLEPFDLFYQKKINQFLNSIFQGIEKKNIEHLILLDDGGELIKNSQLLNFSSIKKVTGIEQTSSGYQKLKNINLKIPVLNVARSKMKLNIESKIVAKTALKSLIQNLSLKEISPENVLIVGRGAIGSAIAEGLGKNCNISFADIIPAKSTEPLHEIFLKLDSFDLILGCTGECIINHSIVTKFNRRKILASLSSSDREFEIVNFRKKETCIHEDILCNKNTTVLNAGFPINFNGISKDVDINEFELTRALLSLAILQSFTNTSPLGFIDLDNSMQDLLEIQFNKKYSFI